MTGLASFDLTYLPECDKTATYTTTGGGGKTGYMMTFTFKYKGFTFKHTLYVGMGSSSEMLSFTDATRSLSCDVSINNAGTGSPPGKLYAKYWKDSDYNISRHPRRYRGYDYIKSHGYMTCDKGSTWKKFTFSAKLPGPMY